MSPLLHYKPKHILDVEDAALFFMEDECGRHHWQKNWPAYKARFGDEKALESYVRAWLDGLNVDHDPREIVDYLDKMVAGRSGKWL